MPYPHLNLRPFISYTMYQLGFEFEHNNPNESLLYETACRLRKNRKKTVQFFTVMLRAVGYTPNQILGLFGMENIDVPNITPNVELYQQNLIPSRPYIHLNKYELGMLFQHGNQNINLLYEVYMRLKKQKPATLLFFHVVLHAYGLDPKRVAQYFTQNQ